MDDKDQNINYNDADIKTLHTYTSDMADAIRTDETSVIKIALAEKSKRERDQAYKEVEGTPLKKTIFIICGIILILGSVAGIYFVKKRNENINTPPQTIITSTGLIPFENESHIDVSTFTNKNNLAESFKKELEKPQIAGSIRKINLESKNNEDKITTISKDELFVKMEITAPGRFTRSVNPNYMIGSYNSHLFFLFESNDEGQSYTGLLEWEKTFLSDLNSFFNIDVTASNEVLLGKALKDTVVANTDARVVLDQANRNILYYTIVDKNKIIITDNPDVIKEVINRLLIKK